MTAIERYRFAPTPSHELHVGNALAALYGWAVARARRGAFVLRIEDIDAQRCRLQYEAATYRDLAWLGLDWDEGPDVGGPWSPYRQSERLDRYDALMDALREAGLAYACVCSRAEIRLAQEASAPPPSDPGQPPEAPYPGTCRGRGHRLTAGRGGYRLDLAALARHPGGLPSTVTWDDARCGRQTEDVATTAGDVLLGRPRQPTYQLAVVADDRAMRITDVVRGVDLIGSTARQILLRRALDLVEPTTTAAAALAPPRHHHHPLLLDDDGRKLSKRDRAIAIATLSATTEPARLRAALGRAIGLFAPGVTRASPADWIDALATARPALADARWCDAASMTLGGGEPNW